MQVVVFEDEQVKELYPATIGRAACMISCGSYRLVDLLGGLGSLHLLVRAHLIASMAADGWLIGFPPPTNEPLRLYVNARLVPSAALVEQIQAIVAAGKTGVVRSGNSIALALLPASRVPNVVQLSQPEFQKYLGDGQPGLGEFDFPLFEYPHDLVRRHLATLNLNLAHRLAHGSYDEVRDGVFVNRKATLGEYLVTNTKAGPIIVEEDATIGPFCYLSGPAYIGRGARLIEYSAIKDAVAIGHTTKIGGEVEASTIEPFTNKQHHGFLGHSYLGSWVNLGAGTCNSDLKNTYGQVNMEYHGHKVPTGMQFFGCVVGDYAKTAINTSIFTGKTVGACSMLYGFVTTNVPSFVNYARSFGQVTEAPVEVMILTQERMFRRRNVQQRPCDIQLLFDMYELTRPERQIAGEPLAL
jgi:glucose-1-phosphate thymidylyltransferase